MELDALFAGPYGPIVIFLLRVVDVSLATTRMLLAVRNQRRLVPVIGFVEILIWLLAVGHAIRHLDSSWHVVAYAGGFAAGNYVGLWIEEKLAIGLATVRIISRQGGVELADALREQGFGATEFAGQGREGTVEMVFTAARRRHIPRILREIDRWDPDAFVTVEEPRAVHRGWLFQTRRK